MKQMIFLLLLTLVMALPASCDPVEHTQDPAATTLEVSKTVVDFTNNAGTATLTVAANGAPWSVVSSQPWCTVETKGTAIYISVEESEERLVRECTLTVTSGALSQSVTIRQLGYEPAILLDQGAFDIVASGGSVSFTVTANVPLESAVSAAWVAVAPPTRAVAMEETSHHYLVEANQDNAQRQASIVFTEVRPAGAPESFTPATATVHITQRGLDEYLAESGDSIKDDIKLVIASATASSYQNGSGNVERAFDGDYSTHYHSNWSNQGADYFPITVTFQLQEATNVDYFIYHPRSDGHNNGNFKEVEIEYSPDGATFTPLMEVDFKGVGTATKVVFDAPVHALAFRFIVKSGAGDGQGFASCAEMEFYCKNPASFDYTTLFSNELCSELKPGVTLEEIQACDFPFFKNLAYYLYLDKYNKEFRVAEFKAYPNPDIQARTHKTNAYSRLDNPTGISVKQGEDLIVMVGPTHGQSVSLFVQNLDLPEGNGFFNGSSYPLSRGVNKLTMRNKGLVYVMYHTGTLEELETAQPIQMHFASGAVNGYFDTQNPAHNGRWTELLGKACDRYFDLVGRYSHLTFETQDFLSYTATTGPELSAAYDLIVLSQQQLMGLEHYNKMFLNRSYLNVMYNSYMNATSYRTSYNKGTMSEICDPQKVLSGACWGPSHEIGHCNQTRKGVLWVGCTEVTNNIMSQYIQTTICNQPSRVQTEDMGSEYRNRYSKAWNHIMVNHLPHVTGSDDVFARLIPFWQLELYFGKVLGQTPLQREDRGGFYPQVYEYARTASVYNNISDGNAQLEFVYAASVAAQTNLIDFFEKWGFLTPVDVAVDDYGTAQLTVTQEAAQALKARVEALGFPKPELALEYISDNTVEVYKNRAEVVAGSPATYSSKSGVTTLTINNWENVAVYLVEDANGNTLYIGSGENQPSNQDWFNMSYEWQEGFTLYAVSCSGRRSVIPVQ